MAETNAERVERLLGLDAGTVQEVRTRSHPNGVEWIALIDGDGWPESRVSGRDHWMPPPLTLTTKRRVAGQRKSGEVKVGSEVVGKDAAGNPITRDIMKDTFEDVHEDDDVISARVEAEAEAAARAKGWRKFSLGAVTVLPDSASVTVTCG